VAASVLAMLAVPPSAKAADAAVDLFKSKCALCDGPDGAGETVMGERLKIPALQSADVQKKSDTDLKTIITKGKDKMPAYGKSMKPYEIKTIVAFIRNLVK